MPPSRIDELRRRVQSDPASIAFAQLAEEYRRSGQTEEAVRVCREGLTRHPGYLSARVTLGRALLDLGQLMGAREELEFVVAEAPENLAAVRGLAEISHREGNTAEALSYYQRALTLARHDPEIEEIVQQLSRQAGAAAASPNSGLSFEEAHQELLSAAERMPLAAPQSAPQPPRNADEGSTAPFDFDRLVAALGSPAAPAQVEAAVEGRATTVPIDLPEPVSLGPDPFAALEAELRATEEPQPVAWTAPWSPPHAATADPPAPSDWLPAVEEPVDSSGPGPFSAADVLADALLTNDPLDSPADAPADAAEAGGMSDPFLAGEEGVIPVDALAEPAVASAAAALEDDVATSVPLQADEMAPPEVPAEDVEPAVVAADASETVLSADAVEVAAVPADEAAMSEPAAPPTMLPPAAEPPEAVLDELENWLTTLQDRSSR